MDPDPSALCADQEQLADFANSGDPTPTGFCRHNEKAESYR
jgi:hypothetical protein